MTQGAMALFKRKVLISLVKLHKHTDTDIHRQRDVRTYSPTFVTVLHRMMHFALSNNTNEKKSRKTQIYTKMYLFVR